MLDKELVDILACPSCRAPVSEEKDEIVCRACGRRYPIRDGIAVMLVEEARVGKGNPDSSEAPGAPRVRLRPTGPGDSAGRSASPPDGKQTGDKGND